MRRRPLLGIALVVGLALGVVPSSPAAAAVTIRNSSISCSLTARLPVLSKTKQLTGSATVSCLASTSVNVQVVVRVVELDGAVVDPMGNIFVTSVTRSLTRSTKSVSWTVTTPAKACVNADGTGSGAALEDYYTVAVISAAGMTNGEQIGRIDYWNC